MSTPVNTTDGAKGATVILDGVTGLPVSSTSPSTSKIKKTLTPGTLLSGADGNTLTGVGVIDRLLFYNGSGGATTAQVYDNITNSGTKLTTTIPLPVGVLVVVEIQAAYSLGVYVDFAIATSCEALGYAQAA